MVSDEKKGLVMMIRKNAAIMVVMICLMTMVVSICSASAAPNNDSKEYVIQAYEKLNKLNSYHITLATVTSAQMQGQSMNIIMNGEADYQVKPVLFKNVMAMTMDVNSQKNEQIIEQYMEQIGNQLVIYTKVDGKWVKQIMPYYDPLGEYNNYFKSIKNVKQLHETSDDRVFEVVISGKYLQENIKRIMASTGTAKVELPADLFNNLGDFTFDVAINKETDSVSKVTIDMSNFMAQLGKNIAELKEIPNNQKDMVRAMFNNMKMTTAVTFSRPNNAEKIVIPQEAKADNVPVM